MRIRTEIEIAMTEAICYFSLLSFSLSLHPRYIVDMISHRDEERISMRLYLGYVCRHPQADHSDPPSLGSRFWTTTQRLVIHVPKYLFGTHVIHKERGVI